MPFSLITDLPCLLSLTSCQHILVHSLPDLELFCISPSHF